MAWRRSTPDFITGISPCAASAWGDGPLPAPCARDTAGDPRPHIAGSERRLVERRNLAGAVPAQSEHRLLPRDGNAEIACDIFHSDCHIVIRSWLGISVGIERFLPPGTHNTGRHASPTRAVAEAGPPPKMMKTKWAAAKSPDRAQAPANDYRLL